MASQNERDRFNLAQEPLLVAALELAAVHAEDLQKQGFSAGEARGIAATALISAAVSLLVAGGASKEAATFAMRRALAAPPFRTPSDPAPASEEPCPT